jgi:hypothetical protein
MTGRTESARAALRRVPSLPLHLHQPIIRELDAAGLLDKLDNDGISAQAAQDRRLARLDAAAESDSAEWRNTIGELKRLGIKFDRKNSLDLESPNSVAAARHFGPEQKLRLKMACFNIGLLLD